MDIEVRIRGLMMDPATNMPIVVLKDVGSDAVMPIWVGIFEANAIALEIEKMSAARPMTHDLARNLIRHLNGELERVVITELRDDTFFAVLWLRQGEEHRLEPMRRDRLGEVEIEFLRDVAGEFEVLLLVLADRHMGRAIGQNV